MKTLPPLSQAEHVTLSRQGGVAFIPGRAGACTIPLAQCDARERELACAALNLTAPLAREATEAGRGDQRYFKIEIAFQGQETLSFTVAEQDAPDELVQLWQQWRSR